MDRLCQDSIDCLRQAIQRYIEQSPDKRKSATDLYWERGQRTKFFPAHLFSDPAWDILLDLYIAKEKETPLTTTAVAIGSHSPLTTALRWIKAMEAEGLLRRYHGKTDQRYTYIELTPEGVKRMADYLNAISMPPLRG